MASSTRKSQSQSSSRSSKSSTSRSGASRSSASKSSTSKAAKPRTAKSTKSRTSSGTAKKNTTGKNTQTEQLLQYSPLIDEIILLLAFACTIILLLSNFNMAGTVGQSIKWLMFGLFGIAAYVVPFIVAGSIIFMLANKDMAGVMRVKAAAVYALSVIAAAVWQRITNVPDIGESVGTYFGYCSEHRTGGGLFGGILCKLLSPLGIAGTMVILIILAIICVILITERSFIGGIRNGGQRFVKEAREDYSAYKQHSSMVRRDEELSDEEYRAIREEERRQARIRKLEKKEQAIAAKKAREEAMSNARMNNVVRGVTNDLVIKDMQSESDNADIDIREIEPVRNDVDVYMDDIYDPLIIPKKHNTDEDDDYAQSEDDDSAYDTSDIWEIHSDTDKNAQDSNVSIAGEDISADSGYEHAGDADNYMDDDITDNVYDGYSEDYNSDIYESVNDNDVYDDEKYDDTKYNDMNDDNFISERNKKYSIDNSTDVPEDENYGDDIYNEYDNDISEDGLAGTGEYGTTKEPYDNQDMASNDMNTDNEGMTDIHETVNASDNNVKNENDVQAQELKKEYKFPPISLLNRNTSSSSANLERENRNTAITLKQTLQNFGVKVDITDISCGPSVTRYELKPELGVKVSKIVSLADDIKLSLAAADIRIEAPIPGKSAIGIEVPNKEAGSVFLRELIEDDAFKNNKSKVAFAAGKDIAGKTIVADIAKMPHLLIAGATGSGKSVCINTIIMSILYKAKPDEVKMIMVDPKVVELSTYNGIPHLLLPVVTDPKKAAGALNWAVVEMDKRYKMFAAVGARNLAGYNDIIMKQEVKEGEVPIEKLPEIVIIVDELADLMMVAPGEVEAAICRLAQLARAAGIHMVIATQRPSVNVITGLIKANVPSRIAFSVSSGVDSRTIIDMNGAEKLLGKGDMLYFPSNIPKPVRVQGAFVSDEEVSRVVDFLKENMTEEAKYDESIADTVSQKMAQGLQTEAQDDKDSLFADAARFVIEKEKGSIGMLQRQFKIGFNRAGRIMDQLSDAGVVGPEIGTKPRKVLMSAEEFESYMSNN